LDFKDYYKILGVSPDADLKEIKKTYQKLTKKYHPDLNPGNKQAEEKFKEINEAYHAISDPVKRKKYDDLRANYQQWQNRGGHGSFDWSAWQQSPGSGTTYTRTMSPEEFAELFGGRGRREKGFGGFSDFFSMIFGMDQEDEEADYFYDLGKQPRKGRDIEGEISITLEEAYSGAKKLISLGGKRIEAIVPKGIKDNNKIRLAGQGEAGVNGGSNGDLFLTVKILPHPVFSREQDDLKTNLEIDFYTAVLGGEARVKTLAGDMMLKIPPQTQTGKNFRLKGKGMPVLNKDGQYGDLYVKTVIVLPPNITAAETEALRKLQGARVK